MNFNYFEKLNELLERAYAPFSNIRVAAILKTDKGLFFGVNVEFYIMSLSICAERNALFNAITNGAKKIEEIHILTSQSTDKSINMCGACREMLSHWSIRSTNVYVYNSKGERRTFSIGKLLPESCGKIINKKLKG